MEIIEKGTKTLLQERVYVMKCRICGCKFTYKIENIEWSYGGEEIIMCPQCNNYIDVPFIRRKYKGD